MLVYRKNNELTYAAFFSAILLMGFLTCLFVACLSSGPVILGTEMNANGSVEYLCLGNTCENYRRMDF